MMIQKMRKEMGKKKKMDQTNENVTILAQKGDFFLAFGGFRSEVYW